jgi:hypothetical protein
MRRAAWDNTCPQGVSYREHVEGFAVWLDGLMREEKLLDGSFVLSSHVASMIDWSNAFIKLDDLSAVDRLADVVRQDNPLAPARYIGALGESHVFVDPEMPFGWGEIRAYYYGKPRVKFEVVNL